MRYWACINNKVLGPFEAGALAAVPAFTLSTLLCPEPAAGGEPGAWKEAAAYPEVLAALKPAAAPERPPRPAAESPLAMTMRGTLIEETPVKDPVPQPGPAPEKAAPPCRAAISPAPAAAGIPEPEPLARKLDQLGATLASIAENQAQLLNRLSRVESAVAEMKALLFPPPPTR